MTFLSQDADTDCSTTNHIVKSRFIRREGACTAEKNCIIVLAEGKVCREREMTDRKAVVKNADMSDDMQQEAVDVATQVESDR